MKHLPTNKKLLVLYLCAILLFLGAALLGLLLGSTPLGPCDLLRVLAGGVTDTPEARIVRYVRIPRTCAGLLCGAALALSGAVLQSVLANRLASPGIIGINSGAGLAVTLCAAFGIVGGWRLSLFAFLGAFLAALLVSLGAKRFGASPGTVILMGVALNALLGAISDAVIAVTPELALQSIDFKIGDFSSVTLTRLIPAAIIIPLCTVILLSLSHELSVLTLGDENATGLGLSIGRMRMIFLLLAALLAGTAVSIAGLLSFVGLLVPHAVRRLSGGCGHLLPLCALFGAGFVSLCDTLARTVFTPYELPVGMIMAFLGAPFFLVLLITKKGGSDHA